MVINESCAKQSTDWCLLIFFSIDSECFLNIKSCERLWVEFISTSSNGVQQHCQEIINYLKNMAYSYSEEFLSQSASHLEESDVWQKSEKLREWFQSDWLPIAKVSSFYSCVSYGSS